MTAQRNFLVGHLRGRVEGGLEAGVPFSLGMAPTCHLCRWPERRKYSWEPVTRVADYLQGWRGDRTPLLGRPFSRRWVRGAVRRGRAPGGGLGPGTSLLSRCRSNPDTRVPLAANGGVEPKSQSAQRDDFRQHIAMARLGIQRQLEALSTPLSVSGRLEAESLSRLWGQEQSQYPIQIIAAISCSGRLVSFEPHSCLLRHHL